MLHAKISECRCGMPAETRCVDCDHPVCWRCGVQVKPPQWTEPGQRACQACAYRYPVRTCAGCDKPEDRCECDELDDLGEEEQAHEPWCSGICDGWIEVDGGFATAPCLCSCHSGEA